MTQVMRNTFIPNVFLLTGLIGIGLLCFSLSICASSELPIAIVEESCGGENTGGKNILIAYDGKHGSTAIVARQMANVLCNCGFQTDVSRARTVADISLYDAVVVGSPIYWAKFLPGAQQFLKKHEGALSTIPVAVFVLSTYVDEETGLVREDVKEFFVDKELEKVPSIKPIGEIGLFGGEYTLRELYPVEVLSMKLSDYTDMDYLNESVVATWTQNICNLLE